MSSRLGGTGREGRSQEKRQAEASCWRIAARTLLPAPCGRGPASETYISGRVFLCRLVYPAGRKTEVRHIILVVSDLHLGILHVII